LFSHLSDQAVLHGRQLGYRCLGKNQFITENIAVSEEQAILIERRNRVMIITLNRPEAMNAINGALSNGLWNAIKELDADNSLTAGVITGNGRAFCAGMDLKAFARGEDIGPLGEFVRTGAQKPLIGAINGFALAGGCEIALTCDLLVASKNAKIGIREVKVGLFAAAGGVFRLPARVGYSKAMEMALTGEPITGEEAMAAGMLTALTEPEDVLETAVALAERIAENAPLAVAASKALVRAAASGIDEDKLWEMQVPLQKKVFSSNDAKEGPVAFAEKRAPNWTGT
jgi:enoyl-CoA hydratase|tara:strand:+ start:5068 stop:5925 length:858 start_codon:yes stop_codon:yes gene_type:complete